MSFLGDDHERAGDDYERAGNVPISEATMRVVASAVESLLRSRPGLDPQWLLLRNKGPAYRSGTVYVELSQETLYAPPPHWMFAIRAFRNNKLLLTLKHFVLLNTWWDYEARKAVSQKEAERLAASAFTRGWPVEHVSDVAIKHANHLLEQARADA